MSGMGGKRTLQNFPVKSGTRCLVHPQKAFEVDPGRNYSINPQYLVAARRAGRPPYLDANQQHRCVRAGKWKVRGHIAIGERVRHVSSQQCTRIANARRHQCANCSSTE